MNDHPAPQRPKGSGTEASEALRDVLEDITTRESRRREPSGSPPDRRPKPVGLIAVLLVVTVWLFVSPPALVRPAPIPLPPPEKIEAGLRMDMYVATLRIGRYQSAAGRLPGSLADVLEDPLDAPDLSYEVLGGGQYRLTGTRDGSTVVWVSSQPVADLLSGARRILQEGAR